MELREEERNVFENDYLSQFGLVARPFRLTPDPAFYFPSASHRKAMDLLNSFVLKGEALALICGEVGTGKTILSRHFLVSLGDEHFNAGLIVNPVIEERASFAGALAKSVGLEDGIRGQDRAGALAERILRGSRDGRRVLVAIDEAQLLSADMLRFLGQLLSGGASPSRAIQVVLFAQEELVGRLLDPGVREVRHAISMTHFLSPLAADEVAAYIEHRLFLAGSHGTVRFAGDAVRLLYYHSGGFPRIINNLCDHALLHLSSRSGTIVDRKIMKHVLEEFRG